MTRGDRDSHRGEFSGLRKSVEVVAPIMGAIAQIRAPTRAGRSIGSLLR